MNFKNKPRAVALSSGDNAKVRVAEYLDFLAAWVRKPRQTASVVPSSRFLARLMVRDIDPDGGRVIELGGGTGVFTREILATGLPPEKLEVVEINPDFARRLEYRFPGVDIIRHRAESISAHVAGAPGSYQQIISGLPLLAMNQASQRAILEEAFRLLAPGGAFVQFTYSVRSPVNRALLDDMGLVAIRVGQTVRNFPPATIFHFRHVERIEAPEREIVKAQA
ncbi:MAG: methyltransferase domain-containing protein [Sphingomonadales bacterium]|nr:MAG: methyltransferase domain-containing protein [Sphingomonadales bacterium]